MNCGRRTVQAGPGEGEGRLREAQSRCDAARLDGGSGRAWASTYNDNETEAQWRTRLHTWIGEEGWLADPTLHGPPKAAAIANKRGGKAKAKSPAADTRKPDTRRAPPKVRAKPKCKPVDGAAARAPCATVDDAEKSRLLVSWAKDVEVDYGS